MAAALPMRLLAHGISPRLADHPAVADPGTWSSPSQGCGVCAAAIASPRRARPAIPISNALLRIHANTLEQLVPFVIAMWLCALYLQPLVAAFGGAVWLIGRIAYVFSYSADPAKRAPGFAIAAVATIGLIIGALGRRRARLLALERNPVRLVHIQRP